MTTTDVRIDETITVAPALSWRSILAGVVIAIVVQLLLSILGGAVGLTLVNPTESGNPSGTTAAVVATIWWTLSGILAAWAGGVTAGRLSGLPGTVNAAWHGLIAWAVTTLLVFWLLASAVGGKKAAMADRTAAERATGYVVGGISPIGQRTAHRTVLDETVELFDTIFVSGGRRGLDVELTPADLIRVTGAVVAPIARD